jgi:inward rectifier potassium channel
MPTKKQSKPISVKAGHLEFVKLNTEKFDWRDTYHLILTLTWPQFAGLIFGIYVLINLIFAALYWAVGNSIAEMRPGSFADAFFFSVETFATVGYGHMYPDSLYGHIIATLEIIVGMFGMAVVTGLIFVRFSRPTARILFSKFLVIGPFDGVPNLMLRVANLRHHSMVEAEFRVMLVRNEAVKEDPAVRRFYPLKLDFDRLIAFPAALTIRHRIDETSPLYGLTQDDLRKSDTRILASIVCIDTVIPAPIQSLVDYTWEEIQWNRRFVEIYSEHSAGRFSVDYGRLHDTEEA